jgi:hypothetical protein
MLVSGTRHSTGISLRGIITLDDVRQGLLEMYCAYIFFFHTKLSDTCLSRSYENLEKR